MGCDKCFDSGWMWWYELKKYNGPANDPHDCYSDDTKYPCDECGGYGGFYNPPTPEKRNNRPIIEDQSLSFELTIPDKPRKLRFTWSLPNQEEVETLFTLMANNISREIENNILNGIR